MFLNNLKIENFRNISKLNLNFSENINIFIGNNAQGKTNILESIYFLAITKSHRTNNEFNLIKKNELYSKISGIYNDNNVINYLSILLNEKGKKVSINNLVQKKISNYLSKLNVIMFCPDDLEIIKGSPSVRRKFLNVEISQLKNEYLLDLKDYKLILKQRNEYLKQKNNAKFDRTYFNIITDKLIKKNIKIVKSRFHFVKEINNYLNDIFNNISNMNNLKIEYKSFINEKDLDDIFLENKIKNSFDNNFTNELLQKTTLIGCHKDDFKLYMNDLDVSEFSSQGQQRLAVLSLKLAEIEVFINKNNIYPIILLDDIFSELDDSKKNNIIKYFKNDIQIFITTTEINNINNNLKKKSKIFKVNNGIIMEEKENGRK